MRDIRSRIRRVLTSLIDVTTHVSNEIVAGKSLPSALGHVVFILVAIYTLTKEIVETVSPIFIALAILVPARVLIARAYLNNRFSSEMRFRISYGAVTTLSALAWGVFLSVVLVHHKYLDHVTVLPTILIGGIAVAGTTSLSPDRWLSRSFVLALLVPPTLTLLSPAVSHGAPLAAVFLTSLLFVLVQIESQARTLLAYRVREEKYRALTVAIHENAKQSELVARERETAAIEAARVKSEFLANMSHEIRTPLNAIIGITDLMSDLVTTPQQKKYLKTLSESGESLLTLVNDILDFSKIDADKMLLEKLHFDVAAMAESQAELLTPRAHQKGLIVVTDFSKAVPSTLEGDSSRIGQILLNLIGNAIKFTEKGEITVRTRLVYEVLDIATVRFEVSDTGMGLSEETIGILFQPFSQADSSTSRKHGGTGLGLSICKKLVEKMGGEIGVESQLGVGSTFWFEIPLKVIEQSESVEMENVVAPITSMSSPLNLNARILVAEDNSTNQMLVLAQLRKLGLTAQAVTNGSEAIDALNRSKFDLILMDCQMPEVDGFEATRRIRELERFTGEHIPIIALTANAFEEDKKRCLDVGMDAYLSKPLRRELLVSLLKQFLVAAA